MAEQSELLFSIFFPHFTQERARVEQEQIRFAYYTTAETALRIIEGKSIWIRNTSLMNDFSEVQHGFACVHSALTESVEGNRFIEALGKIAPGVVEKTWAHFSSRRLELIHNTYILCFSEHDSKDPDLDLGRLSMWRAYGGSAGAAFIFKNSALFKDIDLGIYASPVLYGGVAEVAAWLKRITKSVETHLQAFSAIKQAELENILLRMFLFGSTCTKHRAFKEEREWRVIGAPTIFEPHSCVSLQLKTNRGIPQCILELKFSEPTAGIPNDLHLDALLDYVLIGPCDHPIAIANAISKAMKNTGIKVDKRVHCTGIPLRPNQR